MSARELVTWLDARGEWILLSAIAFAVMGAVATRIGRGGKTDADGRFIGGAVITFAASTVLVELLLAAWSSTALADANLALLLAPPVCCGVALYGVSRTFPLRELRSYRRLTAALALAALGGVVLFLLTRLHVGLVFFGGLAQAGMLFVVIALVARALFRRVTR